MMSCIDLNWDFAQLDHDSTARDATVGFLHDRPAVTGTQLGELDVDHPRYCLPPARLVGVRKWELD